MKNGYKTLEVCKILDLERSTIQYYYDQGLVVPYKDSSGRGSFRLFSPKNIFTIALLKLLVGSGVGIKNLHDVLEHIHREIKEVRRQSIIDAKDIENVFDPSGEQSYRHFLIMAIIFKGITSRKISYIDIFKFDIDRPHIDSTIALHEYFLWVNLSKINREVEEKIRELK